MISEKDEIVLFENGELALEVNVSPQLETVWLSSNQMALLYGRDEKTIRKHVNKIFADGELDRESNTQKMRVAGVTQPVAFYNLDVIISVGYRVNSKQGIAFRKWANSILKETSVYKGYKQDKIEMRGDRAEMSDFPLYLNTVAGGLDRRDQTIGGFSFVVKIYAVPVVEIIG